MQLKQSHVDKDCWAFVETSLSVQCTRWSADLPSHSREYGVPYMGIYMLHMTHLSYSKVYVAWSTCITRHDASLILEIRADFYQIVVTHMA